jgi:hypothetical protein
MKIKEIIAELQKYPQEWETFVIVSNDGMYEFSLDAGTPASEPVHIHLEEYIAG